MIGIIILTLEGIAPGVGKYAIARIRTMTVRKVCVICIRNLYLVLNQSRRAIVQNLDTRSYQIRYIGSDDEKSIN